MDRALTAGQPVAELLRACAGLSDPTPLVWLCARPGFLQDHPEILADHLVEWPETTLLKVLRV